MGWDESRFYDIESHILPSVTTLLSIVAKPALGPWYAKMEREDNTSALLQICATAEQAGQNSISTDRLLSLMAEALRGVKAGDKAKKTAGDIGTAAHALVEWHTRRLLGEDPGPEPRVPDAALLAVEAWKDWCQDVDFRPVWVERVVYHLPHGYAGTADWLAWVKGVLTLGDIKTGKAIYPEAWLQNRAYRSAWEWMATREHPAGLIPSQGMILRLPKSLEDPTFEAQFVPEQNLEDFLAAKRLWQWQRTAQGKPVDRKETR
jgi:hypothetical protein